MKNQNNVTFQPGSVAPSRTDDSSFIIYNILSNEMKVCVVKLQRSFLRFLREKEAKKTFVTQVR